MLAIAIGVCVGCDGSVPVDRPYVLKGVDTREQMALYYTLPHGDAVGRVDATVFAVGWDAHHIIVKRHPVGDRTQTEYFILDRAKDGPLVDPKLSVVGGFDSAGFVDARRRLGVDPRLGFQRVLRDLE
jgi:hypothetical protein